MVSQRAEGGEEGRPEGVIKPSGFVLIVTGEALLDAVEKEGLCRPNIW
jgi:hypothetical protein